MKNQNVSNKNLHSEGNFLINFLFLLKSLIMKKTILIFAALILLLGSMTSCNEKICPAYANNDQTQVENQG